MLAGPGGPGFGVQCEHPSVREQRAIAAILLWVAIAGSWMAPAAAVTATIDTPFAGSGAWVSIFSGSAVWDHPARHVQRMHTHGVRTLFLQTASTRQPVGTDLFRPVQLARFIDAGHARGMRVVAWYLPPLRDVRREYRRALTAIRFRTDRGGQFDGFAVDIEPSAGTPRGETRDENLRRLSRRIRASAGVTYPLGAIIPSPAGLALAPRFWPRFPYPTIGRFYDTVLPMNYYTYRVKGAAETYAYTTGNIAFLRRKLGENATIHMIGGEAGASNERETTAFVQACNDAHIAGASLWHYTTLGVEDWRSLGQLKP